MLGVRMPPWNGSLRESIEEARRCVRCVYFAVANFGTKNRKHSHWASGSAAVEGACIRGS